MYIYKNIFAWLSVTCIECLISLNLTVRFTQPIQSLCAQLGARHKYEKQTEDKT